MNARRLESTLIILALLMVIVSAYQLFVRPAGVSSGSESWQAWLSSLENSAKHRRADDLVWRDLYQGDRLGVGDSVFTGRDARAMLNFKEGGQVTLAANTLLRLKNEDSLNQLLIEQGVVQATLGSEALEFEMDGKKVQLSGAGAQVQITNDGEGTKLAVVEGQAELSEGENKIAMKVNEEVQVKEGLKKRILAYPLQSPKEGALLWMQGEPLVEFAFLNPSQHEVELLVASDLKFKNIITRRTTTAALAEIRLVPGNYFWKVSGIDGVSRVGTFAVKREPELSLSRPANKEVLKLPLTAADAETKVVFEWANTQVAQYRLRLETSAGEKEFAVNHNQWPLDVPVGETIRWKVEPLDAKRPVALSSQWSEFRVENAPLPAIPVWEKEGPLTLSRGASEELDLKWKGTSPSYEWEVLENGEVKETAFTSAAGLRFPELASGSYVVRVRGRDEFERVGAWSENLKVAWQPFESRKPEEGQKIILERPDQKISFEWEGEGEQVFELADDEAFKNILVTQKGRGETDVVFPKVGTFYWRAREADGSYSEPKKVLVEPSPPLQAPGAPPTIKREIEIRFKEPKSSWIDWIIPKAYANENYDTAVTLELPENDQAVSYHVEIYADEALTKKVFSTRTVKTEFEWKGARVGTYWWRYALVDAWGRETKMGPAAELRLTPGDVRDPGRPKLIRPIRAVQLEDVPFVTFAWTRAARAFDYVIEVASDDDFDEILATSEITTQQQIILPTDKWPRGDVLYWRVRARHDWGERNSNTGRFQVGVKKILTAEEKKVLPWRSAEAYSWVSAALAPRKVSVELDDQEYNGKIDGNVLNSVSLAGRLLWKKRWALEARVNRQSGKVFEGQEYQRMEMTVLPEWRTRLSENGFFFVGAGLSRISTSTYRLATPDSLKYEAVSAMSPRLQLEHEWRVGEKSSLHTRLGASFGDWTNLEGELNYRRFWRYELFWELGGHFEQATFKADRGDNKFSTMGLNVGAGISF